MRSHPASGIAISGRSASRWPGPGPGPVLLPACGDAGHQAPSLNRLPGWRRCSSPHPQSRRRAVGRCWPGSAPAWAAGASLGWDGLVAHADSHDHLVITIHDGLDAVAMNPATRVFEDVAAWVSEIPLRAGLWFSSCIGRELSARHRQGIHLCRESG